MSPLEELKRKLEGDKPKEKVVPISEILPAVIPEKPPRKVKAKLGRPRAITPEVRAKIEEVASLDGSVEEMAMYAGVGVRTVYDYLEANEDFSQRIAALREKPILKARNTAIAALNDPDHAHWYLERKKRNEFSPKVEIETTMKHILVDVI
jgi:hypothetical protein